MTDQVKTDALHTNAVDILRTAEANIETIFEESEVKAAVKIANADDVNGAKEEAKQTLAAAQERAQAVGKEAIEKINALMAEAGEPEEAQRLTAILQDAIDNPRPGVRFSEIIETADASGDLGTVEGAALQFEGALNAVMLPFLSNLEQNLEDISAPPEGSHTHALHSDKVELMGAEFEVPGGLYTVVFGVLAVVTVLEVIIAESSLPNAIAFPLLAALSIGKAVIVILYYMHLREDSRIFAYSFGIPLIMAALISVFLLLVDPVIY